MKGGRIVVISLGGSLIIPEKIDAEFLHKFKKLLREHYTNSKFVIVCGGGSIARRYIAALKHENKADKELFLAGIRATRMNAMFVMQFFGKEANDALPRNIKEVESNLHKNKVVICGALRYEENATSDSTAAKLASYFKCDFINMTNVDGLYNSDPAANKNAVLIPSISWQEFEMLAHKLKYKPGQHFVLDQRASTLIREHKIKTFIIGKNLANLKGILLKKTFKGTTIGD